MRAEVLMFYILLLYIIICSIFLGVGLFSLSQYLGCVLIGSCIFLLYYVLCFIWDLLKKCSNYYVHKNRMCMNNLLNDRINACVEFFAKYPLYARRSILLYNKQNYTTAGNTLINNFNMTANDQLIHDELPTDLIEQLRNIYIDNHNISEIENSLDTIIAFYQKYPKAVSFVFHYSPSDIFRYPAKMSSTIKEILGDSNYNKILELDEQQLKTIEESIDNMFFLDSHLYDLNPIKPEAESIMKYLQNNFQEYLYHFTHKDNLEQIKEMGGLYSWVQLENMGKPCPHPGGDSLSRKLDAKYGVADYVHLSFSYKHPMSYRNEDDIVILFIHPIVCLLPDTLFCNMNATDKNHKIGPNYKDLVNINLWTPKMSYLNSGTREFKEKQAEVLVKRHIPLEYIVNINLVS